MPKIGAHFSENDRQKIAQGLAAGKSINSIADENGFAWNSVNREVKRLRRAAAETGEHGFSPVTPGFVVKEASAQVGPTGETEKTWLKQVPARDAFEMPNGHIVKGVSALVDEDDRVIARWIKTREGEIDPQAFVRDLEARFAAFRPAARKRAAADLDYTDHLALIPIADLHMGMHAWGKESGENWDLKIATQVISRVISDVLARTPSVKRGLMLFGGDNLHADSNENRTPRSGHALQVDGRYPKVLLATCELAVRAIDLALDRFEATDVIVLEGNHDPHAAHTLSMFLSAWYRDEPRVTVDLSPAMIRFRQFGKVMLVMAHGHTLKPSEMAGMAAAREPKMWGDTLFRYAHGFHVHHRSQTVSESGGMIAETHQILAPADAWHAAGPYTAGRSLKSILYDRALGETSRSTVAIVPDVKGKRAAL